MFLGVPWTSQYKILNETNEDTDTFQFTEKTVKIKLKVKQICQVMHGLDVLQKMMRKTEGKRRQGQGRLRCLHSITKTIKTRSLEK